MEANSSSSKVRVQFTAEERWELYRVLDIRSKLRADLAYIRPSRTNNRQPSGDFPEGTRSQMVEIRLSINDYLLCLAHRYIQGSRQITGPDPKYFQIDDLEITQ